MKNLLITIFLCLSFVYINNHLNSEKPQAQHPIQLESSYEKLLLKKVGDTLPILTKYPHQKYPNTDHDSIPDLFQDDKVLIFGYGSLMNKTSLARSVKQAAVDSMDPAIAFGVKRIFNYKAKNTAHWGENQNPKEKAMLNLAQTLNLGTMANGVTIEVDRDDFNHLVSRETGYDLVPILVASWDDVKEQNPRLKIRVAYTFIAPNELRNHTLYTSTEFYPVRGYLKAIQCASKKFGDDFAKMWNATTYLADGTTSVNEWDGVTFNGILCTFTP